MPVTYTPIFPQTITNDIATFTSGQGTTITTLYTGGANGSRVESIFVTNTDTNPYTLNVYVYTPSTSYLLGTINIAASTGNTTTIPTSNLLTYSGNIGSALNRDANGNTYLYIASGSIVKVATTTTIASGKTVTFIAIGGDF